MLTLTRSRLGLLPVHFHKFTTVVALIIVKNFISALEMKLMELDQIFHKHWCWQGLCWDCNVSIFANLKQSYHPWLLSKFCFYYISSERINGIWSDFAYALTSTRSRLGVLHVNFCKFTTELWPFVLFKFCFRSISCEQIDQTWSNFAYALI